MDATTFAKATADERDPMSDAAFDRDLQAALDVAPSPEFVARVRTRVAGEVRRPGWQAGWYWMAGAAVASVTIAVIAGTMLGTATPELPAAGQPEPMKAVTVAPIVGPRQRVQPAAAGRHVPARATREAATAVAGERSMPEVLLSSDEQRALRLLVRLASDSEAADALRQQSVPEPGNALPALDIPSLEIEPLPQLARLE